ncbi:MAG TPA: hypothetical protein VF680_16940 [Allosphingosinicella sp.]|jgi:hypothetical protein
MISSIHNLTDFINQCIYILRLDEKAEIIFDLDGYGNEIKLIGFRTDSDKTDFEIYEKGYEYFNNLIKELNGRR